MQLYKTFKKLVPVGLSLLLVTCKYTPTGSHFEPIDEGTPPQIHIDLANMPDSTLIRGTTYIQYDISIDSVSDSARFIKVEFFLDDESIGGTFDTNSSFKLETTRFTDGFHTLKMETVFQKQTESIASRFGRERFIVSYSWIVHIFNATARPSSPPDITQITKDDGALRLNWKPYDGYGFTAYTVYRSSRDNSGFNTYQTLVDSITDMSQTSVIDSNYAGGEYYYRAALHTIDGYFPGAITRISNPVPHFETAQVTTSNNVLLGWNRPAFENGFQKYSVYLWDINVVQESERKVYEGTVLNDTTFTHTSPLFGDSLEYRLYLNDAYENDETSPNFSSIETRIGRPFYPYDGIIYNQNANRYYLTFEKKIIAVDASSNAITGRRFFRPIRFDLHGVHLAVSPDGNHVYAAVNDSIYSLNPSDLQVETSITTEEIGAHTTLITAADVSDNNRLALAGYRRDGNTYLDEIVYVLDMNSLSYQVQLRPEERREEVAISGNGEFLVEGDTLYVLEGNEATVVNEVAQGQFWSDGNTTYWIIHDNYVSAIRLLDCNTNTINREITTNSSYSFLTLDYYNGLAGLIYYEDSMFRIFDLTSGIQRYTIPIVNGHYQLRNKILFSHNGIALPLSTLH